jgi:hypothetical protein
MSEKYTAFFAANYRIDPIYFYLIIGASYFAILFYKSRSDMTLSEWKRSFRGRGEISITSKKERSSS